MAVDIVIQETIETVDITVNTNVIEVNVTRTSGGGGVQTVTGTTVDNTDPLNPIVGIPTLTQVLTVGDRVLNSIDTSRIFQLADRTKYLQVGSGINLTLNETSITFPENSCIVGSVFDGNSDLLFPNEVYYIDSIITEITLNKGDYFELKKGSGAWILTVTNKSIGGITSNKREYYAILTYDADNPTVPIVDEQINEFGAITVSFDDVDGEIILDSSSLFVNTNVIIQNILPPLGDPLETCWITSQTDNQIIIQFFTNAYSANPNWFMGSANFKVKLEKYITP